MVIAVVTRGTVKTQRKSQRHSLFSTKGGGKKIVPRIKFGTRQTVFPVVIKFQNLQVWFQQWEKTIIFFRVRTLNSLYYWSKRICIRFDFFLHKKGVSAICWTIQIAAEKAKPTTHDGTDVKMQYIIEPYWVYAIYSRRCGTEKDAWQTTNQKHYATTSWIKMSGIDSPERRRLHFEA